MPLKDADSIANRDNPDQTTPLGSGSVLFASTYLSENIDSLSHLLIHVVERWCFFSSP